MAIPERVTPWGAFRSGLLGDLGFDSAAELAEAIGKSQVAEIRSQVSDHRTPTPILPPLYFVQAAA